MALTPQETENKYIEVLCDIFKNCEPHIDEILIENFDQIKTNKEIVMNCNDFLCGKFKDKFLDSLIILIKERYSGWDVTYNSEEKTLKFKLKNYILLNFTDEANKRFELLDIRKDDEEESGPILSGGDEDEDEDDTEEADDDIPW